MPVYTESANILIRQLHKSGDMRGFETVVVRKDILSLLEGKEDYQDFFLRGKFFEILIQKYGVELFERLPSERVNSFWYHVHTFIHNGIGFETFFAAIENGDITLDDVISAINTMNNNSDEIALSYLSSIPSFEPVTHMGYVFRRQTPDEINHYAGKLSSWDYNIYKMATPLTDNGITLTVPMEITKGNDSYVVLYNANYGGWERGSHVFTADCTANSHGEAGNIHGNPEFDDVMEAAIGFRSVLNGIYNVFNNRHLMISAFEKSIETGDEIDQKIADAMERNLETMCAGINKGMKP